MIRSGVVKTAIKIIFRCVKFYVTLMKIGYNKTYSVKNIFILRKLLKAAQEVLSFVVYKMSWRQRHIDQQTNMHP